MTVYVDFKTGRRVVAKCKADATKLLGVSQRYGEHWVGRENKLMEDSDD